MVEVRQVVNTIFRSCSYVIAHGGESWLVDCGDVDSLLPLLDGTLRGVLLTHAHYDHIYGLNLLSDMFPSLPVFTNETGREELLSDKLNLSRYVGDPFVLNHPENIRLLKDSDNVPLFDGITATAMFTPGHCPSCITWVMDDAIFTGDSFIPGVKTVTNIPNSDKNMAAISENRIRALSAHRVVYAGHAPEM